MALNSKTLWKIFITKLKKKIIREKKSEFYRWLITATDFIRFNSFRSSDLRDWWDLWVNLRGGCIDLRNPRLPLWKLRHWITVKTYPSTLVRYSDEKNRNKVVMFAEVFLCVLSLLFFHFIWNFSWIWTEHWEFDLLVPLEVMIVVYNNNIICSCTIFKLLFEWIVIIRGSFKGLFD